MGVGVPNESSSMNHMAWISHIVDVHQGQSWGTVRTQEQASQENSLNEQWENLEEVWRQRIWGLSADLNTLRDNEVVWVSDWPPMSEAALHGVDFCPTFMVQSAIDNEDWDSALEYLRHHVIPRDERDVLRGRCWAGLGHEDVAQLFIENAERLKGLRTAGFS
jgi:hypothetical protein